MRGIAPVRGHAIGHIAHVTIPHRQGQRRNVVIASQKFPDGVVTQQASAADHKCLSHDLSRRWSSSLYINATSMSAPKSRQTS